MACRVLFAVGPRHRWSKMCPTRKAPEMAAADWRRKAMSKLMGRLIQALNNPIVWQANRWLLNLTFGLYRRRFRLLRDWGVLEGRPSILDIGCGIGQYAEITRGPYLGIDLDER